MEFSEILYEIALEQAFSQNSIKLVDMDGRTTECCGLDDLERGYNYVKNKTYQVIEFVIEHSVAEASATPSVGFSFGVSSPIVSVKGGLAETRGNKYTWSSKNPSEIKSTEPDGKLHNFLSVTAKVLDERISVNESVDVIVTPREDPTDVIHLVTGKIDKIEHSTTFGYSSSKNALSNSNNFKIPEPKLLTKVEVGTKFIGIKSSFGGKVILGIDISIKVGLEY